ncbi:MAG: TonB family protein [Myxococcales bacterium]|nr:TonB family protein [Myxococcales bacterium]
MYGWLVVGVVLAAGKPAARPALEVDGGLSLPEVSDVLRFHASDTGRCFTPDGGSPRKGDRVRFWWVVDEAGRVSSYAFEDGRTRDNSTVPCLVTQVERWWWPASTDGGTWIRNEFTAPVRSVAGAEPGEPALPDELLKPVVEAQLDGLSACAGLAWPQEAPSLEARFRVDVVVGGQGAVLDARATTEGPVASTGIPGCVVAGARRWRFPQSPDGGLTRWTTAWVVASTERRAQLLFRPDEPAFALIPASTPAAAVKGGGLEKHVISAVIRENSNRVKHCYELALDRNPEAEGKVAVAFVIGPTGDVSSAVISESAGEDPELERCIVERVRFMKFPPPMGGGEVRVTFPWIFKRAGK